MSTLSAVSCAVLDGKVTGHRTVIRDLSCRWQLRVRMVGQLGGHKAPPALDFSLEERAAHLLTHLDQNKASGKDKH